MFGEHLYTIMSNAGVLIFVITILQLMNEVDKDMVANDEVAFFLVQVARKGDEIRVAPSSRTNERGGHPRGEDEEKSEERGLAVVSSCDANNGRSEESSLAVLSGRDTINVRVDPQHDRNNGRTCVAPGVDEIVPDQKYGSEQCETFEKKTDET